MSLDFATLQLNWTPAESAEQVNHSSHLLEVRTPAPAPIRMLDEVRWRLANFAEFNGGHNHTALVYHARHNDVLYACFDMSGWSGFLSSILNGAVVAVRLWCDGLRTVFGDTVGRHMLIGQRRWSAQQPAPDRLQIVTEAHERARGFVNKVGLRLLGRSAQREVWHAYLQNIDSQLTRDFQSQGTVIASPVSRVSGNPWSPQNPYPPRGGPCW